MVRFLISVSYCGAVLIGRSHLVKDGVHLVLSVRRCGACLREALIRGSGIIRRNMVYAMKYDGLRLTHSFPMHPFSIL